jgi:uncharacterized protein YjcR
MAKKQQYFAEAERLYVSEQCTLAEIASRLRLAEKTVRTWKDDGDWETKRAVMVKEKQRFDEELYMFARKLLTNIMADMDNSKEPSASRLYTLTKLLPQLTRIKEYEDTVVAKREKDSSAKAGLSADVLKLIESEILGI